MSAAGRFWLGPTGSESLFQPDGFVLGTEDFEINREGRVANGALVIDTIASKKRFTISYTPMVGQDALDALVALYVLGVTATLNLIVEGNAGGLTSYTVKFRPFSRVRMATRDTWLYQPVTFTLEEV